MPKLRTDRFEN